MKFFTSKQNEEIAGKLEAAEAENETLRADIESAQAKIEELTANDGATAILNVELAEAKAKVYDLENKAVENDLKLTAAIAAAEVTAEKVSIKAAELLATQGHPAPVNLTGDTGEAGGKTMTRAAFNALDHIGRNSFVAGGGKITA